MKKLVLAMLLVLLLASGAWAENAVVVFDGTKPDETNAKNGLKTKLEAAGHVVTEINNNALPADLSPYDQLWDLRIFVAITAGEEAQIVAFLNAGKRAFIMGENTGFMTKNNSIESLVAAAGGGVVNVGAPNSNNQNVNPPWDVEINTVTYLGAGAFDDPGNGTYITDDGTGAGNPGTGIAFSPGTMTNAPTGTLAVIADVNFLQPGAWPGNGLEKLTEAIIAYVSGVIVEDPPVAPADPVVPAPEVTPGVDLGAAGFSGGGCFLGGLSE